MDIVLVAVMATAGGLITISSAVFLAPEPLDGISGFAWFSPVLAVMGALLLFIGVAPWRVSGLMMIAVLTLAPLVVALLVPVAAVTLLDDILGNVGVVLHGVVSSHLPFLLAGALLPIVMGTSGRVRVRSDIVATVLTVVATCVAVWLSGAALQYSRDTLGYDYGYEFGYGYAAASASLLGAAVMLAAAVVVAGISAACRRRPWLGLVAFGTAGVLSLAAALVPSAFWAVLGENDLTFGVISVLCSQFWFAVVTVLALRTPSSSSPPARRA